MWTNGIIRRAALVGMALFACEGSARLWADEVLVIRNGSFETPETGFVTLLLDSWERFPKPESYVEEGGFLWNQLTGIFANSAPGSSDHLVNLQGRQSMWVFAVPNNGVWQRVQSGDGSSAARIQEGDMYRLSLDLLGGGGGMKPMVPINFRVQAMGEGTERTTVASFMVTNSVDLFPTRTRMRTFEFISSPIPANHPAIGQPLAIEVRSAVSPEMEGGYWNVDAVRLVRASLVLPQLAIVRTENGVRLGWGSLTGWRYQLYRSDHPGMGDAYSIEVVGTGGELALEVPVEPETNAFFRLQGRPPQ